MIRRAETGLAALAVAAAAAPLLAVGPLAGSFGFTAPPGRWASACWAALAGGALEMGPVLLAVVLPVALVGGRCVWTAWRQVRSTAALLRRLPASPAPPSLAQVARELGLVGFAYADTPDVFAFAHRGGVLVSRGLVELLPRAELRAVLRHERRHLERRAPARLLAVTALARATAFLPASGLLHRAWVLAEELEADRAAALEGRETVASALLRLARHAQPAAGASSVAAGALDLRVRALLEGGPAVPERSGWARALWATLLVVGLLALAPGLLHLLVSLGLHPESC